MSSVQKPKGYNSTAQVLTEVMAHVLQPSLAETTARVLFHSSCCCSCWCFCWHSSNALLSIRETTWELIPVGRLHKGCHLINCVSGHLKYWLVTLFLSRGPELMASDMPAGLACHSQLSLAFCPPVQLSYPGNSTGFTVSCCSQQEVCLFNKKLEGISRIDEMPSAVFPAISVFCFWFSIVVRHSKPPAAAMWQVLLPFEIPPEVINSQRQWLKVTINVSFLMKEIMQTDLLSALALAENSA